MGRKIRTKIDKGMHKKMAIGGWLSGKGTYIWFGDGSDNDGGKCLGIISGQKLYRLAKAVVRQFEGKK